jgi:hypothetical protein
MEDKHKTERKCLGEVTNTSTAVESKNTNHHYLPPPPQSQRFLQMELKLMELNSRLDILSEKFEHLIANVRKTNDLLQLDLQVSIENRVISHGNDQGECQTGYIGRRGILHLPKDIETKTRNTRVKSESQGYWTKKQGFWLYKRRPEGTGSVMKEKSLYVH